MRKKIEWIKESLDQHTYRAKVIGGWLVTTEALSNKGSLAISTCFVSDKDHEWHILVRQPEKVKPAFTDVEPAY